MAEAVIYSFKIIFGYLLCIQWGSVLLFLILEWAMVDYYRWGTFKGPTSIFQKILNIIMAIAMGSGYFLYSKFEKYNWITRKFFMLLSLLVHGISSMIVYYMITATLEWIFL